MPGYVVKRFSALLLRLSASLYQPFNSMNNTPGRALRQGAEPRRVHHTTASLSQPIISSKSSLTLIILLTYNNSLISLFIFLNPIITLRCAVVTLPLRCAPLRTCDGCISVAQYSMEHVRIYKKLSIFNIFL